MDPNFNDAANIELAKMKMDSKGSLVAKKVVKAGFSASAGSTQSGLPVNAVELSLKVLLKAITPVKWICRNNLFS